MAAKTESWKFTNDKLQREFGSRRNIMAFLEELPNIIYPLVGFVKHEDKNGKVQLYIAYKRKDYKKNGMHVPALMRYDPNS